MSDFRSTTLISTVGTSLFFPNLAGLKTDDADPLKAEIAGAFVARNWRAVAGFLAQLTPQERLCGAEVNSIASLMSRGFVAPEANLFFCHSDTDDGRAIGAILQTYYHNAGHPVVELRQIAGLQDADPRQFRTHGLRNLAKDICAVIRSYGAANCAINATGGYKAQIAIAVMMGQALHVPVYYKHERFDDIIAFPPMPVSLDFDVWLRASRMLFDLSATTEAVRADDYSDDWDDRCESLIERVTIDGVAFIELSAAGQIFHETFRERFRSVRDQILPPPALPGQKRPSKWEDSGHLRSHPEILNRLQQLTDEIPQILHCATFYFNPALPTRNGFRLGPKGIEGCLSDGRSTVKFRVESTAQTPGQQAALVAMLNESWRT